jgi:hypothetical protein
MTETTTMHRDSIARGDQPGTDQAIERPQHSLFSEKRSVSGRWVAIMDHARSDRAMTLSPFRTRCLRQGEIHEVLLCAAGTRRDEPIDYVTYLGFGEIASGGVVEVGDTLYHGQQPLGVVLGFDETHVPNHYNIVVSSPAPLSGRAQGLTLADTFCLRPACGAAHHGAGLRPATSASTPSPYAAESLC